MAFYPEINGDSVGERDLSDVRAKPNRRERRRSRWLRTGSRDPRTRSPAIADGGPKSGKGVGRSRGERPGMRVWGRERASAGGQSGRGGRPLRPGGRRVYSLGRRTHNHGVYSNSPFTHPVEASRPVVQRVVSRSRGASRIRAPGMESATSFSGFFRRSTLGSSGSLWTSVIRRHE